jgi:hypothetical protein
MTPSAAHFKKLLRQLYLANPEAEDAPRVEVQRADGSTVLLGERQLLISCVLASAEAVEKTEVFVQKLAQAVGSLAVAGASPVEGTAAPGTPITATVGEEEEEDMTPLATSSVIGSSPATKTQGNIVSTSAPQPIAPQNGAQGSVVTTTAPQPIAPRS